MEKIDELKELLYLKNFSEKTIKNYTSVINNVSNSIGKKPEYVTEHDLRKYIVENKQYSSSTRTSFINAFKSLYKLCLNKKFDHSILPRPKIEQKQPDILSKNEFQLLINSIVNLKHKSIVALMYSCAMRVSEVINLRVRDIDSSNNKIVIKNGKGKVDRIVMLDESLLQLLRKYYSIYAVKHYLFEGSKGGKYSVTSIQNIVKKAVKKVGINKNISSHSLRHSCLTQLIKDGVDLRTVQKIAGHKNINTTANYIKIMDSDVIGTVSPLSNININHGTT